MAKGVPQVVLDVVWEVAQGNRYQEALLSGREMWSGASLRGAAKNRWGRSYAQSRDRLVDLANAALARSSKGRRWRVGTALAECRPDGRQRRELLMWPEFGDEAICWSTGARVRAKRPKWIEWGTREV